MSTRSNAWALFLFGLGANLYIQVVGYLAFSEFALLVAGPAAFFVGGYGWREPKVRAAAMLMLLWAGSAIFSDWIQHNVWACTVRGVSRPLFLVSAMIVGYRLLRPEPRLVMWFFLGLALSNTISMYAFKTGSIDVAEQAYDITISGSFEKQIISIVLALVPFFLFRVGAKHIVISGLATGLMGGLSVFFGSRSAGAIIFVAGCAIVAAKVFLPIDSGRYRITGGSLLAMAVVFAVTGFGVSELYKVAASRGLLGDAATKKYIEQSQNKFGLIAGGRLDFLSGLLALADSPIIGHGSWATDTKGYMLQAADLVEAEVDPEYERAMQLGIVRIPTHSQILETWVEHGIIASLFWWFVVWVMFRCTVKAMFIRPDLFAGVLLVLLTRWWDLFFSPLGGRVAVGVGFALFMVLVDIEQRGDAEAVQNEEPEEPQPLPSFVRYPELMRSER